MGTAAGAAKARQRQAAARAAARGHSRQPDGAVCDLPDGITDQPDGVSDAEGLSAVPLLPQQLGQSDGTAEAVPEALMLVRQVIRGEKKAGIQVRVSAALRVLELSAAAAKGRAAVPAGVSPQLLARLSAALDRRQRGGSELPGAVVEVAADGGLVVDVTPAPHSQEQPDSQSDCLPGGAVPADG